MMNGMMGLDPATAAALSAAAGGEMDSDTLEKLATMNASMMSMNANMNMMEDLQIRSKMLEELYGRAATASSLGGDLSAFAAASAAAAASTSKEPGETSASSPAPSHSSAPAHSKSKSRKSAATVTKGEPSDTQDDQPEDLSMKSSKTDAGSEGRLSRESLLRDEATDKLSEGGEDRHSRISDPSEGRHSSSSRVGNDRPASAASADRPQSVASAGRPHSALSAERPASTASGDRPSSAAPANSSNSRTSERDTLTHSDNVNSPPPRPASQAEPGNDHQNNQSENSRCESPDNN